MAKFGKDAPIGANAKLGSNAWGGAGVSGSVLFDGVLTIEEMGAIITLNSPIELGKTYELTYDNSTFAGECIESDDGLTVELSEVPYTGRYFVLTQLPNITFIEAFGTGGAGDYAIKIVRAS